MPRKRPISRKVGKHSATDMKDALRQIKEGRKIRAVSREKNIPFETLRRYASKISTSNIETMRVVPHYDVNKVFSDEQEKALKDYYNKCALMFYGLTTKDCRKVAYEMAAINNIKMPKSWITNKMAGIDWLKSMRKRHPELSLRKPEACSLARATAFNMQTVKAFYDNLEEVYKRHPLLTDGTRVYNLDETATTTVQKPQKVIGPKGKNLGKVTSGEKGTLVTTCCFISGGGQYLPPVLIFPRKNFKEHMMKGAPSASLGLASPSGWMNSELFVQTMKHFVRHSYSSKENPSILIMDNHESHLAIEALDIAKNNGVTILTLHPHTSAKLQPLDVGIYSPFKSYYNAAMESWLLRNPGKPVTIYELAELIGIAFIKSMTPSNIINAFKKTGIHPFDRHLFTEEDFLPSSVTDRPNPYMQLNNDRDEIPQQDVPIQMLSGEHCRNSPSILQEYTELQHVSEPELQLHQEPLLKTQQFTTIESQPELQDHHQKDGIELESPHISQPEFYLNRRSESSCDPHSRFMGNQLQNLQPGCSTKKVATVVGTFVSPDQFRDPIKATERKNTRKRRPGRSMIATDTPEKENIRLQRAGAKQRKVKKNKKTTCKKAVRKVLQQSDTEEDDENMSIQDSEDSDWCVENEYDEEIITDQMLFSHTLPRVPEEGDYVLVVFASKRKSVYYVGKVLHGRNKDLEYYISFLRANRKYQFHLPNVPDLSYVKEVDIKLILPKPSVGGSTVRQQCYYYFKIDFSHIDIR